MSLHTHQLSQSHYMPNDDRNELAEGLRKWLEEGHLNNPKSVPETIDIAQLKRKAAQRIMAAQRALPDEDDDKS